MSLFASTENLLDNTLLVERFLAPIRNSATYVPAFGRARGGAILGYRGFHALYSADPFYHWLGLDNELVYAAHKASGGLTSLYRQIGVGTERLFRDVLRGALGLSEDAINWSYEYEKDRGEPGVHTLDARIRLEDLSDEPAARLAAWLEAATLAGGRPVDVDPSNAVVFEVRQGYKSADSKRQNADLRFGMRAYRAGVVPALAVMSSQVSEPVIQRYRKDGIIVLTGTTSTDPSISTFAFMEQVVGYDLGAFLARNSEVFRAEIEKVAHALLSAEE